MATYYVDNINGTDDNDGLSIKHPYKTVQKFTFAARNPGDICYVRAGQKIVMDTDTNVTSDGSKDLPIQIIGCQGGTDPSGDDDPWGDGIDTRTIIDGEGANDPLSISFDNFWVIKNLAFENAGTGGVMKVNQSVGIFFDNCVFRNNTAEGAEGVYISYSSVKFTNCQFYNNEDSCIQNRGIIVLKDCTFNAGAINGERAIKNDWGTVQIIDSNFGQTTQFANEDLYCYHSGSRFLCRNCNFTGSFTFLRTNFIQSIGSEDHNGVYGANEFHAGNGTVIKSNDELRPGGSPYSAKLDASSAYLGSNEPLHLTYNSLMTGDFKVWVSNTNPSLIPRESPSVGMVTITVYMKADGWTKDLPEEDELYLEATYYDEIDSAHRGTVVSTEQLTNDWTAFNINCDPMRDGFIYISLVLKKNDTGSGVIYVDPKPEIISRF